MTTVTSELEAMARAFVDNLEAAGFAWRLPYIDDGLGLDDVALDGHFNIIAAMRTALMAIREPTEALRKLAGGVVPNHELADSDDMIEAYQAIIDHILGEPS